MRETGRESTYDHKFCPGTAGACSLGPRLIVLVWKTLCLRRRESSDLSTSLPLPNLIWRQDHHPDDDIG